MMSPLWRIVSIIVFTLGVLGTAHSTDTSPVSAELKEECKTPIHISSVESEHLLKALRHIEECVVPSIPDGKIDVYVSGLGGAVIEAQAFYDQMRTRGFHKHVRFKSYGIIASASNIVWMASDERVVTPGSMFLLHKGLINVGGDDPELGVTLKEIQVQNSVNSIRRVAGDNAASLWNQCIRGKVVATAFDGTEAIKNGWATKLENYE